MRPEKGLRASPRNPKTRGAKKRTPKKPEGRTAETGGKTSGKGTKTNKKQTKRNVRRWACDLLA